MLQRLRATVRSTPIRLSVALGILITLDIGYGVLAFSGASHANSDVTTMRAGGSPFTIDAQTLYTELSDADANASAGFVAAAAQPGVVATGAQETAMRKLYDSNISAAAGSLSTVIAGSHPPSQDMERLVADLPIYHGMVVAARLSNPTTPT